MISKNTVARVVNGLLFLSGCFLLGSGWLLAERMPHGKGMGGGHASFLGMGRHDWGEWHGRAGYVVALLGAVHLALHARWLIKIAAENRAWRLVAGFAAGLAIVAFFMLAPVKR